MENNKRSLVGVIMGSDSDYPVMQECVNILKQLEIPCEVHVVSAHRTPERMYEYAHTAEARGLGVIVAGAGGAAHLPGMVASITCIPVIGVPVKSKSLDGLDSLLSIVQMPAGIPVAAVAINGAKNAGILAAQILGINDETIRGKLRQYKENMKKEVLEKDNKIQGEVF